MRLSGGGLKLQALIFSFAGGSGVTLFCVLTVVLCIVPLCTTLKTENYHENLKM
jgi:hypothetical protein